MIICLGLVWGSFIGALSARLVNYVQFLDRHPCLTKSSYLRSKRYFLNYFVCDRSKCDSCKNSLEFFHNIPFISYLKQKGRCQFCQIKIPISVFLFEVLFLGISIVLYFQCPSQIEQLCLLGVFSLLAIIAYLDFKTHLILSSLSFLVMWLGFYAAILFAKVPLETSLLSTIISYVFLKLLAMIYLYGLNKTALGDADPLLAGAIGSWLDPLQIPYFFLLSSVIMLLGILINKNKENLWNNEYPFGVGLALAWSILITYSYLF